MSMPWYGELPERWETHRIKKLARDTTVKAPPEGRFYVGMENIISWTATYIKTAIVTEGDSKQFTQGDVLFGKLRPYLAKVYLPTMDGVCSGEFLVLRGFQGNVEYLKYLFLTNEFIMLVNSSTYGAKMPRASWDFIGNCVIPLPPREEQDQIVRYLDWKVSVINKLINAKRRQIALLQEQKQEMICEAVYRGLNMNRPMKFSGLDWLGNIPEHWEIRTLFGIATEQEISNKTENNQNLLSLSYGKIINKDINTTDGLLPTSFDNYQIVNNGNIILRFTDLQNDHKSLRVGLATQTGIITSAYTCLKIREGILPEYVYYLLHSYDICKVFYGMGGGVRQSIAYKDVRKMIMFVPSFDEQQSIVVYLDEQCAKIDSLTAKLNEEIALFTEYRTRLISDVVTGKLDVRGVVVPEYEAIEELAYNNIPENEEEGITDEDFEFDKKVIKLPTVAAKSKSHNQQFDDAVIIAGIVNAFYDEKYPLGRKKIQKLLYLLRRHQDESTSAFKKKAAGPYADEIRYKGGEPIAKNNKYVTTTTKKDIGTSFARGEQITQALEYIEKWGNASDIQWLVDKFRYTKVNILELYATVDMAICDLDEAGIQISVESIKNLIATNKEWKAKLKKQTFSDKMIFKAINDLKILL